MLCVGSLGTIFAIMMTSLCKKLYQFILAQGVLLGICMALIVAPMIAIVSKHFHKKRAAAIGMMIGGSSLGGVIWPVVVHELLQKPNIRFGWTMRIV
jgi:MFS family permease